MGVYNRLHNTTRPNNVPVSRYRSIAKPAHCLPLFLIARFNPAAKDDHGIRVYVYRRLAQFVQRPRLNYDPVTCSFIHPREVNEWRVLYTRVLLACYVRVSPQGSCLIPAIVTCSGLIYPQEWLT